MVTCLRTGKIEFLTCPEWNGIRMGFPQTYCFVSIYKEADMIVKILQNTWLVLDKMMDKIIECVRLTFNLRFWCEKFVAALS